MSELIKLNHLHSNASLNIEWTRVNKKVTLKSVEYFLKQTNKKNKKIDKKTVFSQKRKS